MAYRRPEPSFIGEDQIFGQLGTHASRGSRPVAVHSFVRIISLRDQVVPQMEEGSEETGTEVLESIGAGDGI